MKHLLALLLLCLAPLLSPAQTLTVEAPGTQAQVQARARQWAFTTHAGSPATEPDAATLLLKGRTPAIIRTGNRMNDGAFTYELTIETKTGKARASLSNVRYQAGDTRNSLLVPSGATIADDYPANWPTVRAKSFAARWALIQAAGRADLQRLLNSFQDTMQTPASDF